MSRLYNVGKGLKEFIKKVTHEVPTGPHTDVRRRKINPSFKKKIKKITGVGPPPKIPRGTGTKGGFGAVKRRPKGSRNF